MSTVNARKACWKKCATACAISSTHYLSERAYCDWVARFIRFHRLDSRDALFVDPARKVEDFLTHLAVHENVAASTQNQAFNALVFLYRRLLEQPCEQAAAGRVRVQAIDDG